MVLPADLLNSLQTVPGFDREAFEQVHASGDQVTSVRLNPGKPFDQTDSGIPFADKIPWTETGYYLSQRPSFTFDPLFHAGCYYVQEASSMFLEQALKQNTDLTKPLRVLDLCAAPGGKSTHLLSLLSSDSLLVSNEVIRQRALVLQDNLIKWGQANVMVTNNDPRDFALLENYFDLIVADAPCSGSGLFRRDPEAIEEWSLNSVALCSQRQQRILADVLPALKKGGLLIYSTCSYSTEENEDLVHWLLHDFGMEQRPLDVSGYPGIQDTGSGYRFWPGKIRGEGFFICCLEKKEGEERSMVRKSKEKKIRLPEFAKEVVQTEGLDFFQYGKIIHALPETVTDDILFLQQQLKPVYAGTAVGEIIRDKLIPHHALAQSRLLSPQASRIDLEKEQAIQYLQRKELQRLSEKKGWQLAAYKNHPLGWMNVLPNRINNYYPQMLRILKD